MSKVALTDEERKILKEKKKEENLILQNIRFQNEKRAELSREKGYGKINLHTLHQTWKNLLLKIHQETDDPEILEEIDGGIYKTIDKKFQNLICKNELEEQRRNLLFNIQAFERLLDSKDFTISLLKDELENAKYSSVLLICDHIANIDKLINLFHEIIEDVNPDLESYSIELRNKELAMLNNGITIEDVKLFLNNVIEKGKSIQFLSCVKMTCITSEHEVNREMVKKTEEILQHQFMELYFEAKTFLCQYIGAVKIQKSQFGQLFIKESNSRIGTKERAKILVKKYKKIERLKKRFSRVRYDKSTILYNLQKHVVFLKQQYAKFAQYLSKTQSLLDANMRNLVRITNDILDWLERRAEKGKHILILIEACGKLETEKDKILKLPLLLPISDSEFDDIQSQRLSGRVSINVDSAIYSRASSFIKQQKDAYHWDLMKFHKKMGEVEVDLKDLKNEKKYLIEANAALKENMCKLYCCIPPPIRRDTNNSKVNVTCCKTALENYIKYRK